MTSTLSDPKNIGHEPFHHEAAVYSDLDGFKDATLPFIRRALAAREPVLVAVSDQKISLLRAALGLDAEHVRFADMSRLGANPAHIIPAWVEFVAERPHPGARVWGIGEPIGPDRSPAALTECQLHESLLNIAFADAERFNLLCPYDTEALPPAVVAEAHSSHPMISHAGVSRQSQAYRQPDGSRAPGHPQLTPAPPGVVELAFERLEALSSIRSFVHRFALAAGLAPARVDDLVLAVNELVANSFTHGGGRGVLRIWGERGGVVCDVSDEGNFADPLAGRRAPRSGQLGGWGLWLANQVCELVQVRRTPAGSIVRVHVHRQS